MVFLPVWRRFPPLSRRSPARSVGTQIIQRLHRARCAMSHCALKVSQICRALDRVTINKTTKDSPLGRGKGRKALEWVVE